MTLRTLETHIDNATVEELELLREAVNERAVELGYPRAEQDIEFKVVFSDAAQGEYGSTEDPSSYIHLCDPTRDIEQMLNPDDIVINKKSIRVSVVYPLEREHIFPLKAPRGSSGFSRAQLARTISKLYQHIYDEEDRTSPAIVSNIPGMLNRCTTEGRYGLWGHGLEDLLLHTVSFDQLKDIYRLGIDS